MKLKILLFLLLCLTMFNNCVKKETKGGSVRLSYWDNWGTVGPDAQAIQSLLKDFQKENPGIKIDYQWIGTGGQSADKFITSIAGGQPPDVYLVDRFLTSSLVIRDCFTNLDAFIAQSGLRKNDFFKACWDESTYNGHIWTIPFETDLRVLYYRIDDFIEAGLDPDKPPKTWDELESYADKLTKFEKKGQLERAGFIPGYGNDSIYMYGWLNGGRFMTPDGKNVTCNEPEIVQALEWMVKMRDRYGIQKLSGLTETFGANQLDPFIIDKVSMEINGDWMINFFRTYAPNLRYGIAVPPCPKGKKTLSWSGGFAFCIPRGAKHPQEAWKFIEFMVSKESQLKWGKDTTLLPALKAAAYEGKYYKDNKLMVNLMEVSKIRPVTPIARMYWDELVQLQDYVFLHQKTPKKALDEANVKIQAELDKVLSAKPAPK